MKEFWPLEENFLLMAKHCLKFVVTIAAYTMSM